MWERSCYILRILGGVGGREDKGGGGCSMPWHPSPVVLVTAAAAISLLGDGALYSVLPTLYQSLSLEAYQVGILLSANRWIRLLTNHLAKWVYSKLDTGLVLAVALILGATTSLPFALLTLFPILLLARVGWGISWSFIRYSGLTTVTDCIDTGWMSPDRIGATTGFFEGVSRLGSVGGSVLGAVLSDYIGFGPAFIVLGLLGYGAVPFGMVARLQIRRSRATRQIGERVTDIKQNTESEEQREEKEPAVSPEEGLSTKETVLRNTGLLVAGFVNGAGVNGIVLSTLGLILSRSIGDSLHVFGQDIGIATITGLLLGVRWLAEVAVGPLIGILSDYVGRRVVATISVAGAAATLFVAAASDIVIGIIMLLCFFLFAAASGVVFVTEANHRRVVSNYVTSWDLGSSVGPLVGWAIAQAELPLNLVFVVGGCLYCASGLLTPCTYYYSASAGDAAAERTYLLIKEK